MSVKFRKIPWQAGYDVLLDGKAIGVVHSLSHHKWSARPHGEKTHKDFFESRADAALFVKEVSNACR